MEYNIGQKIKVKTWEELPVEMKTNDSVDGNPKMWTKGKARNCGRVGVITDKLYSEAHDCFVYHIRFNGQNLDSKSSYTQEALLPIAEEEDGNWRYEFGISEDVVVVTLYEGDREVMKGHAHLLHDGVVGYAQAASYALKKIYEKLNGGLL